MYTFENLKDDVKKEAAALKVHATKEELGRLNMKNLDPSEPSHCVYGLMTGNCYSPRALELINKCAERYYTDWELACAEVENEYNPACFYSPIEAYLLQYEAKNANLIAYLKSETETLEL